MEAAEDIFSQPAPLEQELNPFIIVELTAHLVRRMAGLLRNFEFIAALLIKRDKLGLMGLVMGNAVQVGPTGRVKSLLRNENPIYRVVSKN